MYGFAANRDLSNLDAHTGPYDQWLERYQTQVTQVLGRDGIDALSESFADLVELIANTNNLRLAWDHSAEHGGETPGLDGWRYDDFNNTEIWDLLRLLSQLISSSRYSPGGDRPFKISKGRGRGTRTLRLQNIVDRVAARAVVQVIQPILDPTFAALSFGSRPKLSHWHALSHAERLARLNPASVMIATDIRNAFDNVPLNRLLDNVNSRLKNPQLTALSRTVIANPASRGLRQGSPLSPLLLNLYLDHRLDRPWQRQHPDVPLLRYVDDLLLICPQGCDPRQIYDDLFKLLQGAGMTPKGEAATSIHRLDRGDRFVWLGCEIAGQAGQLEFRLPSGEAEQNWHDKLREKLELARLKRNAPQRANEIVLGVIDYFAPCAPALNIVAIHQQIKDIAIQLGFDDIPPREIFEERLEVARGRWDKLRAAVVRGVGAAPRPRL